jgi:hypothetical protein
MSEVPISGNCVSILKTNWFIHRCFVVLSVVWAKCSVFILGRGGRAVFDGFSQLCLGAIRNEGVAKDLVGGGSG